MNKFVLWDLDDDPSGNVRHIPIDEHLTKDDVEHAVQHATWIGISRSSGFPILMGPAVDGRTLSVVYEEVDEDVIRPITAWFEEQYEADMVNVQRLVRDRYLTEEEAQRYQTMREAAEREKDEMSAHLKSSLPGFRSWEELAEFRALVKSLLAARETKGLSREEVARTAGLEPEWIADLEERRELNAPVWALSSYASAVGQQLVMALAESRS